MKKSLLLFCFALCLHQSVLAQWSITPKVGSNFSKPYFTNVHSSSGFPQDDISAFFVAGLDVSYQFAPKWQANIGGFYSPRGVRKWVVFEFPNIDLLPTIEYMPNSFLSIYSGFSFAFSSKKERILDMKNDVGALLGLKGRYKNFVLHAHFNHSLQALTSFSQTDDIGTPIAEEAKLYNQMLQIGLGYTISFNK